MNNKVKFALAMGTFIILVFVGFFLNKKDNKEEVIFYTNDEEKISKFFVYVVGEVNEPGVFEVLEGTRVYEVIELAGGTTADADISRLNLAKILEDEEKITVPKVITISEDVSNTLENGSSISNGIININTADINALSTLSGIGKSTAEKIIKYRNENGYFNSIEDIMNVSGIGENKFNSIKDNITV